MLYLLQTGIPEKKPLVKGLLSIFGVGTKTAENCLSHYGILKNIRSKDLRRNHRYILKMHFEDYPLSLGEDLKQSYKTKCQRLIDIISYKGRRHKGGPKGGYPVRGQRTHTNAKTQRSLHKRWLINAYEKPKVVINPSKNKTKSKITKSKTAKAKPVSKPKPKAVKTNKYKI